MKPAPVKRREIFGWAMFDFANSSYATLIVTVAYSVYFTKLVAPGAVADMLWGVAMTVSNLTVMLLAPALGAAADETGRKREFLAVTAVLCLLGTLGLYFVMPGDVFMGLAFFVLSLVGFALGENLIAAFLPEISTPRNMGRISGFGWALGYLGGLGCLMACWPLLSGGFTLENLDNLRWAWVVTGLFFLLSALPTFVLLRERAPHCPPRPLSAYARASLARLSATAHSLGQFQDLARFLLTFFVFFSGLTTIIAFAAIYAERTLGFGSGELVLLFITLQVSSAVGAFAFGFVQDRLGARPCIRIALVMWIGVCIGAYLIEDKRLFWAVAFLAGLGIGSVQSASRALVGTFTPAGKSGEFFGLWGLAGKGSAMVGPLIFGAVSSLSGSQRVAIACTAVFFVAGLWGMGRIDEARGREAARQWRPPA